MVKAKLPQPLQRDPQTDMEVERSKADSLCYVAIERVVAKLLDGCDSHLRMTKGHLLRSLKLTHQSMVTLVTRGKQEHMGDLLPLTRMQVERVLMCMLLVEDPGKYLPRFRKAAWKATITRDWRMLAEVGYLDSVQEFKKNLDGQIYDYAKDFDVTPDEVETLRSELHGTPLDAKYMKTTIPEMPNAGNVEDIVKDSALRQVAQRLYVTFNDLCNYSHGGFLGVMIGGLLGGHIKSVDQSKADTFFEKKVVDPTFPCSYVCMMTAATLFGLPYKRDPEVVAALINGWSPHLCEATALGIVVWDAWAREALGALG